MIQDIGLRQRLQVVIYSLLMVPLITNQALAKMMLEHNLRLLADLYKKNEKRMKKERKSVHYRKSPGVLFAPWTTNLFTDMK